MEINASSMYASVNQYMPQNTQMQGPPPPPPGGMDGMQSGTQVGLSGAGQVMGMDSESRAEMEAFHETVMAAIDSGEFDAEALAEEAPQALKDLAEAQGTDVASMLEGLPEKMESMASMAGGMSGPHGGMPPMGPPPGGGMGAPSEEMESFMDTMVTAVESGETDLESLVEAAPEEIEAMAADLGMEVEDLVSDMLSRIEENGDPRDQAPPSHMRNQEGMDAYAAQMGGDDMRTFMNALFSS